MALAIYSSLSETQDQYADIILRRAGRKDNDLSTGIHALRGVCIRSFPELLLEIKTPAMSPPTPTPGRGEIGTGIADVTVLVSYLLRLIYRHFILMGTTISGCRLSGADPSRR